MPINGASIPENATLAPTGGTAKTFTSNGLTIKNGIQLIDASVTDFRIRPSVTLTVTPPYLNKAVGQWTKGKKTLSFTYPKLLANGAQEFPNISVTLKDHPEMTVAEIQRLCNYAAQFLFDADFTAFWNTGSVA